MRILVIVESPNKIKSIEKYLGNGYEVKASVGHIVKLPSTGEHRFGVDMETWTPKYKIHPDKKKVVDELKEAIKNVDMVYVATDPDREGEAIADNLVEFLKIKDKYKRIRFNEITKNAILEAIKNPTIINEDLVNSQIARRILDRIIGYKLSTLAKQKISGFPVNPSAGRVQSIALKLVIEREDKIEKFVPVQYALGFAKINDKVKASFYQPISDFENKKWIDRKKVEGIKSSLSGSLKIKEIKISQKKDKKYIPLKQSALYKKGDSQLNISSRAIQTAAQKLYEGYGEGGLISYPRTDSTRLSNVFVQNAQAFIKEKFGDEYIAKEIKGSSGAQDAHEAIRPTSLSLSPEMATGKFNLSLNEAKVYKLIWTHTIQALMSVPIREITRYEFVDEKNENDFNFQASSSKLIFDGYHKATGFQLKAELPKMSKGDLLLVEEYIFEDHETQPPARYNDGSLIEKMDNIGVGRPSTFATTLNILKTREYVSLEGRALKPTEFGRIVMKLLLDGFSNIINEEYTATMEKDLDIIADGQKDYKKLLDDFWQPFNEQLQTATHEISLTRMAPVLANKICPLCQSELLVRRNKKNGTTFFGCSNFPKCRHIEFDPNSPKPKRSWFNKKKTK